MCKHHTFNCIAVYLKKEHYHEKKTILFYFTFDLFLSNNWFDHRTWRLLSKIFDWLYSNATYTCNHDFLRGTKHSCFIFFDKIRLFWVSNAINHWICPIFQIVSSVEKTKLFMLKFVITRFWMNVYVRACVHSKFKLLRWKNCIKFKARIKNHCWIVRQMFVNELNTDLCWK